MTFEEELLGILNQIPVVLEKAFTEAWVQRHPGHSNQKTHGNRFGGYGTTKESLRRLKGDKEARERYKETARKKTRTSTGTVTDTAGFIEYRRQKIGEIEKIKDPRRQIVELNKLERAQEKLISESKKQTGGSPTFSSHEIAKLRVNALERLDNPNVSDEEFFKWQNISDSRDVLGQSLGVNISIPKHTPSDGPGENTKYGKKWTKRLNAYYR